MEICSPGALKTRRRYSDKEAWRYGALELWRHAVDGATRRYRGMEASCRHADVEA
jgi:hypothetical protein